MKKLTASILASALMISAVGINAFATETTTQPKITVYGNESNPAAAGEEASFIVRLSDFKNVKGMDLTITSDGRKVEFIGAAMDKGVKLTEGSNIKSEKDKIHIVDLASDAMQETGYANITVKAKVNGADTIKVSGTLAKDGENTIDAKYEVGKAAIKTSTTNTTKSVETVKASDNKHFIPYGFVKDVNKYIVKEKDGSFANVPAGQEYAEFELPQNGITTFAVSKHETEAAIQFGTYTDKATDDNTRGTLLFEGNWEAFKNYYITENGYSVNDILTKVNVAYDNALKNDGTIDGIEVGAGSNITVIVRRLEQTKEMWAVKSKGLLQYAARLKNAKEGTTYTAVGYLKEGNGITFSENVVTTTYTK